MLFGVAAILTRGQFYYHLVVYPACMPYFFEAIPLWVKPLAQSHAVLLSMAIAYVIYSFWKRELSLFAVYFVTALPGILAIGNSGGNVNYFLEIIAVICVLAGFAAGQLSRDQLRDMLASLLVCLLLIMQIGTFYTYRHLWSKSPDYQSGREVSEIIRKLKGEVLSEDGSLLVLNGKNPVVEPFLIKHLARQGLWNERKLLEDLATGSLSLVIMRSDVWSRRADHRFSEAVLEQIRRRYRLSKKIGGYYLYEPLRIP